MSTSCFSGDWTRDPELSSSTITAAGKENGSLAWRYSGSTGDLFGSIFTTALVQKLTKIGATNISLVDDDEQWTENQEEIFAEFTRTVYEYLLKNVDRRGYALYGVTDQGLISMVSTLGAEYFNSYKGFDDAGDNTALHGTLRMIQDGRETDIKRIDRAHKALEYRMTQMSTADKYLQMMDIAAPKGQLCCEYNTYNIWKDVEKAKYSLVRRLILDRELLFPCPTEDQGRPFHKGMDYLIAAFHYAETAKDLVVEKLDTLVATLDRSLEQEKEMIKNDPEVRSKRRRLYQAFGVALEDMSPGKRLPGVFQ